MKLRLCFGIVFYTALLTALANGYVFVARAPWLLWVSVPLFVVCNVLAGIRLLSVRGRLCVTAHGAVLLTAFCAATVLSVAWQVLLAVRLLPQREGWTLFFSVLVCFLALAVVFWNGFLSVWLTSTQLGLRRRFTDVVCLLIPLVNAVTLLGVVCTVNKEVVFEVEKQRLNRRRAGERVCATRYPLLLVHGVFFRDTAYFNYWGRIPAELEKNGATIYYGNHASASSVADSAAELAARIRQIVEDTGCGKVNIIAHSKGGLDCRYALAHLGIAPLVASLTTVNTPHRGCPFADFLLDKLPAAVKHTVAKAYDETLKRVGKEQADFLAAVTDLTAAACEERTDTPPAGVLCQSIGSVMPKASGGQFPLNYSHHLVKFFDGANDGLVSEASFAWGERYTLLKATGERGISHGDMIDLNRENIDGFDVREFYVGLVSNLKDHGL